MEALELITTTEAEARSEARSEAQPQARSDAADAYFRGPIRMAACVKCGAMPAAAAAVPSVGGLGSGPGVYAAADVPPGTAGRAAALGV